MTLLTVHDAAVALGVSSDTIRRWSRTGVLRTIRLPSRHRRFRLEDIEALERQMVAEDEARFATRPSAVLVGSPALGSALAVNGGLRATSNHLSMEGDS